MGVFDGSMAWAGAWQTPMLSKKDLFRFGENKPAAAKLPKVI